MDGKTKAKYFLEMIENEDNHAGTTHSNATGEFSCEDEGLTNKKENALTEPQNGSQGHTHIINRSEGEDFSILQAQDTASKEKDLTLAIVTSRAKRVELRLRNMKKDLSGELNGERRERLKNGIAEYEIRLDELKRIEAAAAGN